MCASICKTEGVKLWQAFLRLEQRTDPNPRGWAIVAGLYAVGAVLAFGTAWELSGTPDSDPPSWIPLIGAIVLGMCAVGGCWRLLRDHKRLGSVS
jgi:hypothetical protein